MKTREIINNIFGILCACLMLISVLGLLPHSINATTDIHEPDNSPATASIIPTDGTLQSHSIDPAGDIDYISFSAISGKPYLIETSNLTGGCDTYIYLYDIDGNTIIEEDDDGGESFASRIDWTPVVSGIYYVMVRHYYSRSGTGSYDISVNTTDTDIYEPDNTFATASIIPTDGTVQSHSIGPVGDMDYISFDATSGTPYLIETSNLTGGCNTSIYLYDTDGTSLISNDNDSGEGQASKIEWTPTASGTYYVKIINSDSLGFGFYDVRVKITEIDLYEPDDTTSAASNIPADGTVQSHTIEPAGDIDYISFAAISGTPYLIETFNLTGDCDTCICLYDTDGSTLIEEEDDGGEGLASRIEWTPTVSGTYFIEVYHYDSISGTGSYDISINDTPDAYEPDNTPGTAGAITTDGTGQSHAINPAGDIDYISFDATSGTPYLIETSGLTGDCNTFVYLYDADGTTLISEDDDGGEGLASRIEWTPTASGTYYVKVIDFDSSGVGFYNVSVSTSMPDKYEPDNTPATANTITSDGTVQSHTIDPAWDIDYISFSATSGAPCLIETSDLTGDCDTYIYLYDIDGTSLISEDDDSGEDLASRIEWTPAASGTYYIKVIDFNNSGSGSYNIIVSDAPDIYETDDILFDAKTIPTDGTGQRHTINPAGDIDYISFSATSGTPLLIETSNLAGGCDTFIYLYDTNGTTLIAEDNDSGEGLSSRIEWAPPVSGIYYVKVINFNSSGSGFYDFIVKHIPAGQPIADFEVTPVSGEEPVTMSFADLSISYDGVSSWFWDFGDGQTSTQQNPTHVYTQDGNYTITFTVTDSDGSSDTRTRIDYITVSDTGPEADFSATPTSGDEPLTVNFADASTFVNDDIVSWLWDFGDGQTSTRQNPAHIYTQDGNYTITFTVTDSDGSSDTRTRIDYITVSNTEPAADFSATPTAGDEPLTVNFADTSTFVNDDIVSWLWDFGDGQTSTRQNPAHIYTQDGVYTVILTVTDSDGSSDTRTRIDYITVSDIGPAADFSATPTSGDEPLTVNFVDTSTFVNDDIVSWLWDFGDGQTSTQQNPAHIYTLGGNYTITLTVTDSDGSSNAKTETNYIVVSNLIARQTISPDIPVIVRSINDQIIIEFPEGSVDDIAELIIREISRADLPTCPEGFKAGDTCFIIDLTEDVISGTVIKLTVNYSVADLEACSGNPDRLTLARYNESTGEWTILPTTVDPDTMTLATETDHFSTWLVLVNESPAESATSLWIWLLVVSAGLGIPLTIGSAVIIKRGRSSRVQI